MSTRSPNCAVFAAIRVLQVTSVYYPELQYGGPPLKIHLLSRELRNRGFSVSVLTFHSEKPRCSDHMEFDRVSVQYLPWIGQGFRQWPLRRCVLFEAIRQADIVHCYGLYNALCPLAAWYAKRLQKPYFLEPLGMYRPRVSNVLIKELYHRCFTSWMARYAFKIVASSHEERTDLRSLVSDETTLTVRRNGIDVAAFRNLPSQETFRANYDVRPSARIILYLGRISPIKNLEQLIQAFHIAECGDSMLVMAGPLLEPEYAARIRTVIESLHLKDSVRLIGPLYGEDKLAALAATDLFVLPSVSESFGNAAAEAVAAGVPVLLTETCGIAPMIHRRAGLAVPLGIASIASGLRIMMSQDRRRFLQEQEQVPRELGLDEPVQQTARLYESALTERRVVATELEAQ